MSAGTRIVATGEGAQAVLQQFERLAGDALAGSESREPTPSGNHGPAIEFAIVPGLDLPREGYRLRIGAAGASLRASDARISSRSQIRSAVPR